MSAASSFFVRRRVRLGYPVAVAVLWFARCSVVRSAKSSQHSCWRCPRARGAMAPRLFGRISSQARNSHGRRALCTHAKPALSRQRNPGAGHGGCHAFLDVCDDPVQLFRPVLFDCHAQGRK